VEVGVREPLVGDTRALVLLVGHVSNMPGIPQDMQRFQVTSAKIVEHLGASANAGNLAKEGNRLFGGHDGIMTVAAQFDVNAAGVANVT